MTNEELDNFHQRILEDIENNCLHSRGPIAMTVLYSDIASALQAMVVRTCRAEEDRDAARSELATAREELRRWREAGAEQVGSDASTCGKLRERVREGLQRPVQRRRQDG